MIGLPRLIQQISTLRQMSLADNVDTASTKLSDSISLDFLVDVHSPTNQTNALEKIILHGESKFDLLLLLMSTYIAALCPKSTTLVAIHQTSNKSNTRFGNCSF